MEDDPSAVGAALDARLSQQPPQRSRYYTLYLGSANQRLTDQNTSTTK